MNTVIKSGDLRGSTPVRSLLSSPSIAPITETARHIEALERELEHSKAAIARLETDLAATTKASEVAQSEAYEAGVAAGLERAEDQSVELRQRLDIATAQASQAFVEASNELISLAGDVPGVALSRIVGDPSAQRDLVIATVQRAVIELVADAEIIIEVSAEDFADGMSELEEIADGPKRRIEIASGLASGDCRIRLPLGMIDLSLPSQVERLRARLAHPSEPTS